MMRYPGSLRWPARAGLCCLAAVAVTAASVGATRASAAAQAASTPPACSQAPQPAGPTTVSTIEQAYYCIFAHYYSGPVLDDRVLLAGAFGGLTEELDRLGIDQPDATLPALTGSRDSDLAAFAAVYSQVMGKVPARDVQEVAAAAMTGMVAALNDNHARWTYPAQQPPGEVPGDEYGVGGAISPSVGLAEYAPGAALPPLTVTSVDPGSPFARAGIRPGDIIASVDGAPPFADGMPSAGVFRLLEQTQQYPPQALRITVRWPVTGATRTVTVSPALYKEPAQSVTAKLLDGDIGYVQIPAFYTDVASQVETAVTDMEKTATLRGLILDLRAGGGGTSPAQLLGALEHGSAYGYDCTVTWQCTADYPDASIPLLHLPLAVLTDRDCLSACDEFIGAVKDLHLGTLIGTRTAGIIAGGALGWALDDGSDLSLPAKHAIGADHELINGIGVAPDYYIPVTAQDLATGHDPDITKALALLKA